MSVLRLTLITPSGRMSPNTVSLSWLTPREDGDKDDDDDGKREDQQVSENDR